MLINRIFLFQAQKAKERERRELGQTLVEQKRKRDEDAMIKAAEERRKDKVIVITITLPKEGSGMINVNQIADICRYVLT